MTKDYTLLRTFDLEKAKAGEAICHNDGSGVYTLLGEGANGIAVKRADGNVHVVVTPCSQLRMAPLAWVEGKPVYRGDRPYIKVPMVADILEVEGIKDGLLFGGAFNIHPDGLTWTPPKKTREETYRCYSDGHKLMWLRDCGISVDWQWHEKLDITVTVEE